MTTLTGYMPIERTTSSAPRLRRRPDRAGARSAPNALNAQQQNPGYHRTVDQRLADVGLHQPDEVNHRQGSHEIDQPVSFFQRLPSRRCQPLVEVTANGTSRRNAVKPTRT